MSDVPMTQVQLMNAREKLRQEFIDLQIEKIKSGRLMVHIDSPTVDLRYLVPQQFRTDECEEANLFEIIHIPNPLYQERQADNTKDAIEFGFMGIDWAKGCESYYITTSVYGEPSLLQDAEDASNSEEIAKILLDKIYQQFTEETNNEIFNFNFNFGIPKEVMFPHYNYGVHTD